jgi:hypothetical protein
VLRKNIQEKWRGKMEKWGMTQAIGCYPFSHFNSPFPLQDLPVLIVTGFADSQPYGERVKLTLLGRIRPDERDDI